MRSKTLVATLLTAAALAGCQSVKTTSECLGGSDNCGGVCTVLGSDNRNCGACGNVCSPSQACSSGTCIPLPSAGCPVGQVACGTKCVDPLTDETHCGASAACTGATAGTACAAGEICSGGTCALTCQASLLECGGKCIDPLSDRQNCGASGTCIGPQAGTACTVGEVCAAGSCAVECPAGQVACAGRCIDPLTDRAFCGASGTCAGATSGVVCAAGQICSSGACALTCQSGLIDCGGKCIDPLSDRQHCGASGACTGSQAGTVCAAGQVCAGGACGSSCPPGQVTCNGKCVDPLTDRGFCGAAGSCSGAEIGKVCAAGEVCAGGVCTTSCPIGEYTCGGKCIDPQSDPSYCGAGPDCSGGTACGADRACYQGTCGDVCTWARVYFADLTVLPTGATASNGVIGGQGPASAYGRTAWYVTSDWSLLTVPVAVLPGDAYFAAQVDFYLPAGSAAKEQRAGMFLFNDPNPGFSFGTHGLLTTLQDSGPGTDAIRWWIYPTPNPPDAFDLTQPVSFTPSTWHTLRVEADRSACSFRTLVDGAVMGFWNGVCDTAGAKLSLYSRNDAVQPTAVAWSNLAIFRGSGKPCAP